jgi:hypothetical protein
MRVPQVSERIKEAPAQALRGVFAGIGQLLLITDKLRNKGSHQDVPRARTPGASASVTDTAVTSPAGQGAGTAAGPAGTVAEAAPAGAAPAGAAPVAAAAPPAAAAPAAPGPAESSAAKPATARRAAKPTAGKPVTPKPAAKPVTAKPPTARRPAAKAAAESAAAAGEAPPKPPKRQSTRDFDKTGNVRLLGDETADPAAAAAPQPAAGPEPAAAADPAPLPNYDELSVPSLRARLRNLDVTQVRQLAEYERAHAARAELLTMFERRIAKLEAEA